MLLWMILSFASTNRPPVTDLKSDERLVFFPTHALQDERAGVWRVRVHGWLFEPERGSIKRRALKAAVRKAIGVPDDKAARKRFDDRIWRFLVDNERNKPVAVRLGGKTYELGRTNKAGHVRATLRLSRREMQSLLQNGAGRQVVFRAELTAGDKRRFDGRIAVVPPTGLSVISDIDDTIKVTRVTDRSEMLANTFYRPFKPVAGMAELYRTLQKRGAVFHFVSASPWQLSQPLQEMLAADRFPDGTLHLRDFRLADVRSLDELTNSNSKKAAIEELLQDFPKRRFLLFGDSGERDPELYGEFARKHPKQITGIFIRNVTQEQPDGERFRKAFREVDRSRWTVFAKPKQAATTAVRLIQ